MPLIMCATALGAHFPGVEAVSLGCQGEAVCGLFGPLCLWLLTRSWPFPGVSLVTVGTDGRDKELSLRLTSQWRVGGPGRS